MPRNRRQHVSQRRQREPAAAREQLERRWFGQYTERTELAALVTGQNLRRAPFHRWLPYRQGFAPELVHHFLSEAFADRPPGPLLDPFSGSGTVAVECARQDRPAVGVEALPALAFIARQKGAREFIKAPRITPEMTWKQIAELFEQPLHRAALLCGVAARHAADGRLLKDPPPLFETVARALVTIKADLKQPLPRPVDVRTGDARALADIEPETIAGILTSPPYLSRYDYARTNRPLERVYRFWYGRDSDVPQRATQIRAHPDAYQQTWQSTPPPAVSEVTESFRERQLDRLAGVVRSYFEDLTTALRAWHRVLIADAPCWIVIGGARLRGVYIPADLILPEIAEPLGYETAGIQVARHLISAGRKLGSLDSVTPRESIIMLRKSR